MSLPTRTSLVRGPGAITFAGQTIHSQGDIIASLNSETANLGTSLLGTVDALKSDQSAVITITPCGEITAEQLAVLYPHQTPVIGGSILTATDKPLVILSRDGRKLTFTAAGLTGIPDLDLSPVRTAFGQATFTALPGSGLLPDAASAIYKEEAQAWSNAAPDSTKMLTAIYHGTFGDATIYTNDGWKVSIELSTEPVVIDDVGTIDYTLTNLTVRASCTPVGLTAAEVLALLPINQGRGTHMFGDSDLVIAGAGGLTVTLKNARVYQGPLQWGASTLRVGEIGFVAHIDPSTGQLYEVTAPSAPSPQE